MARDNVTKTPYGPEDETHQPVVATSGALVWLGDRIGRPKSSYEIGSDRSVIAFVRREGNHANGQRGVRLPLQEIVDGPAPIATVHGRSSERGFDHREHVDGGDQVLHVRLFHRHQGVDVSGARLELLPRQL